jgi:hypothetical protein
MSEHEGPRPEDPEGEGPHARPPSQPSQPPPPAPESIPMPQPPPPGAPGAAMSTPVSATRRPEEERRALLAQQLQQAATRGLRVESSTEFQAVLIEGKPINHTLHAILTIFTCLIWGIVWAIIAATGGETRHQLIVDEFGNVHWQNLGKR